LVLLKVKATLVRTCKPEDEHCEIATAQLTFADNNQGKASYSFLAGRSETKLILPENTIQRSFVVSAPQH